VIHSIRVVKRLKPTKRQTNGLGVAYWVISVSYTYVLDGRQPATQMWSKNGQECHVTLNCLVILTLFQPIHLVLNCSPSKKVIAMQTNITVPPSSYVNKQTTGRRFALCEDDVFIAISVLNLVTSEFKLVEGLLEAFRPSRMIASGWRKPLISILEPQLNFSLPSCTYVWMS
jgi:hypothetical protein